MWITSRTEEEAAEYRKKLDEYKWTLRLSSKSADFLGRALASLNDSTVALVHKAAENLDSGRMLSAHQHARNRQVSTAASQAHLDTVRSTPYDLAFVGVEARESTREAPLDEHNMDGHSWFQALTESEFQGA